MSLYGSIQIGGNTLRAMQIGLQVVGNNIANSNTPGFIREKAVFTPAPVQRIGTLTLGLGVEVAGIVQSIDKFAEERLRDAGGDRASAEVQEKAFRELETILGELRDTDISSLMTGFFNSIDEVLNQPGEVAIRNLTVQSGNTLTTAVNTLHRRVNTVFDDFSARTDGITQEINTLTDQIRKLNLGIVTLEGGTGSSEAGGLRSERHAAIKRLGELVNIRVTESEAGASNVTVGGEFLVFEATRRELKTIYSADEGRLTGQVVFAESGGELRVSGGELHGIYEARDAITGKFLNQLDTFAATLAREFNKVYSQGQGISGFRKVTSHESVADSQASLDNAGLAFAPESGAFDLLLHNTSTGLTDTHTVVVDLNGLDGDTSLFSLAAELDAIPGVSAVVNSGNQLEIVAESSETELGFSGDTSGVLAALGINTFFTGSSAADLGINSVVVQDGSKFAAATDGVGLGTDNAVKLVALHDDQIDSLNGGTISGVYDQLINETTQGSTVAAAVADGLRTFEATLDAAAQGVSGVSLDEEAIDMIMLQRTYQAAARYISTLSDLLDVLMNL
jgi:flagellar hook-associated protein 1 FlgK